MTEGRKERRYGRKEGRKVTEGRKESDRKKEGGEGKKEGRKVTDGR